MDGRMVGKTSGRLVLGGFLVFASFVSPSRFFLTRVMGASNVNAMSNTRRQGSQIGYIDPNWDEAAISGCVHLPETLLGMGQDTSQGIPLSGSRKPWQFDAQMHHVT